MLGNLHKRLVKHHMHRQNPGDAAGNLCLHIKPRRAGRYFTAQQKGKRDRRVEMGARERCEQHDQDNQCRGGGKRIADQHNAKVLGHKGHPDVQTPHLDRMAAEGVRFDNAITQNPDLHTMPFYQAAQERREALDDTFSPVAFAPPLPKAAAKAATIGPLAPTPVPQIIQLDSSGNIQITPSTAIQIKSATTLTPTTKEQPSGKPETPSGGSIKVVPADAPASDTGAASQPGTPSKNPDVTDEPARAPGGED